METPRDPSDKKTGLQRKPQARREDLSSFVFGKVPPQAIPLEEAVLGALMLERDALTVVLDILQPDSFYLEAHKLIYRAMLRLFEKLQPVDLLTVTEELKKTGHLEAVGGAYYLVELTNKVASAANIEFHARIISQKFIQRELIRVSTDVIRNAYEDTTDVFDLLDDAEQGLFSIAEKNMSRSYETMGSLASKALKQLEELKNKEEGLTGVPTGFTNLDRMTSGWQPSDLIIVAARPGMGKCLGKGTLVLMFDGSLKKVEDIRVGDLLMGDDSTPRRVLSLARGRENMYWIRQKTGIDYRVNESHILSLKTRHGGEAIQDISVRDLLQQPAESLCRYKGFKVGVEFPAQNLPISPYLFGLRLGGNAGASQGAELAFATTAAAGGLGLAPKRGFFIAAGSILEQTQDVAAGYIIPHQYLVNSSSNRLELLAGFIDGSAGLTVTVTPTGFELKNPNQELLRQVQFVADTLGFRTSFSEGEDERALPRCILRIVGDVERIPMRAKRPNFPVRIGKTHEDWRLSDISIEFDGVGDYYGFEIDGNRRFLLADMTVTHNTSFVLSLAKNAAVDFKKPVALFSLEMSSIQLAQRLISMEAEIPLNKLRNGKLEEYEWQQLRTAIEHVSDAPVYIDDTPGINVFELRAKCRRMKMQYDIQMVIIDYLQLMSGGGENQKGNREQEVSAISRALKGLAKELQVPVIALSQLSRAVEVRGGSKRPQLSDLRESGSIEQDADIVAFIYRPEYYQILEDEQGQSLKGVAEIIIAKHRNGATDTVKLRFIDQYARFSNLDDADFGSFPSDVFNNPFPNIITRPSRMNDEEDIPF